MNDENTSLFPSWVISEPDEILYGSADAYGASLATLSRRTSCEAFVKVKMGPQSLTQAGKLYLK